MPPKLDYMAVDAAIQANPELSSRELCKKYGFNCSEASICKRKQLLGISGSRRGRKVDVADRGIRASTESIVCRCPKCGRDHMMPLFWTGRGVPRVYCEYCRNDPQHTDWESRSPDCYGQTVTSALHQQYM